MGFWKSASAVVIVKDHAVRRMMERDIFKSHILEVLGEGMEIEQYPEDFPYPSALLCKIVDGRPIHIVAAYNEEADEIIIVTTYVADETTFGPDYITRKKK